MKGQATCEKVNRCPLNPVEEHRKVGAAGAPPNVGSMSRAGNLPFQGKTKPGRPIYSPLDFYMVLKYYGHVKAPKAASC